MTTLELAERIGVKRATVSDYISKARKQGYTIERDTKAGLYYLKGKTND